MIFGKVISCTGDTEGHHEWGLGLAFRHCQCHYDAMQQSFYDYSFQKRSTETHERHCKEIDKVTYEINHKSLLCDLHGFDITTQLPHNISITRCLKVLCSMNFGTYYRFTLAQLNTAVTIM